MSYLKFSPRANPVISVNKSAGYLLGATSIDMDGFLDETSLLKQGYTFMLGASQQVYTISSDTKVLNFCATSVTFTPALVSNIDNNTAVYFATDITDATVAMFNLTYPIDYLAEADEALVSLGQRLGAFSTDELATPLHYVIRRYLSSFVCMRVCEDKYGINNVDTNIVEKYKIKYDDYVDKVNMLEKQITLEMLTGCVTYKRDRVSTFGTTWRGD